MGLPFCVSIQASLWRIQIECVNMARQCGIMTERRLEGSDSRLEILRIQRTKLSQDEFAAQCSIPRRTYQRWISGETPARPTPRQWKSMMRLLRVQSIDEIPDDFGPAEN